MRRIRGALVVACVLGVAVSCSLLNPLDGYSGGEVDAAREAAADTNPPPPPDATVDAPAPTCDPLRPPTRPPPTADTPSLSLLLAGDSLDYGEIDDGFDLDGLCTCPGAAACLLAANPSPTCDGKRGVDNALGPLLTSALALFPGGSQSGTALIKNGGQNIVVQLRGYNGTDNDDSVQFGMFSSPGIVGRTDAGLPSTPKLDGTDTWQLDDDSVLPGSTTFPFAPRIEDRGAYVRDGMLVATLDLNLRIGLFRVRSSEARLTGRLVREGAVWRLSDGRLSGRMFAGDLLTGLEGLKSPITLQPLCRDEPLYLEAKRRICEAMDLPGSRTDDGRGLPCRALSLTLRLSAITSVPGPTVTTPQARPCGSDWLDDCPP